MASTGELGESTSTSRGPGNEEIPWHVLNAARLIPGAQYPVPSLAFFHIAGFLKQQPRQGWVRAGISKVESVADHSWRMALLAMTLPTPSLDIDRSKAIQMCLIHDLAESLVGDITPFDGVLRAEKRARESAAMRHISELSPDKGYLLTLWQEYEDQEAPESHWVHDLDKLDLLLQMVEYEESSKDLDLGDFAYVSKKLKLPGSCELAEMILKEREDFWGGKEHKRGELDNGGTPTHTRDMQDTYYRG